MGKIVEQGELFFFYRPRLGVHEVASLDDVQRFYLVTAVRRWGQRSFRLFVIGRKKLPEIIHEHADPRTRYWGIVTLVTTNADELHRELSAHRYLTKTRGERILSAAKPVGEARYDLVRHATHTELAYVLELPARLGPAQREFNIHEEASYIIAVRNPRTPPAEGFPGTGEHPVYPPHLDERFGERRWIPADDPALLDYPHAQLLLLGAHLGAEVEEELGIRLPPHHTEKRAEVLRMLRLRRDEIPLEPLFAGKFPDEELPETIEPLDRESLVA